MQVLSSVSADLLFFAKDSYTPSRYRVHFNLDADCGVFLPPDLEITMSTSTDFTGIIRDFGDIEDRLSNAQLFELAIHCDRDFLDHNSYLLEDAIQIEEQSVRDGKPIETLTHNLLMQWIAHEWISNEDHDALIDEALEVIREDCNVSNESRPESAWIEHVNHFLGNPDDRDMVVELGRILTALECLADPNEAICDGIQRDCDVAINMGSGPDLVDVRKLARNLVERVSPRVREYVQDHC